MDLSAFKQKQIDRENKTTGKSNDDDIFWSPYSMLEDKSDKNPHKAVIRILPIGNQVENDIAIDTKLHYNVDAQRRGVLCPKRMYGEPCPICNVATQLYYEGKDSDNKKVMNAAKKLFVQDGHTAAILVRSIDGAEQPEEVRLFKMTSNVYKQVFKLMVDEEDGWGDITDQSAGFDLVLNYLPVGAEGNDTMFTKTEMKIPRTAKPTPIFTKGKKADLEKIEAVLSTVPNIDEELNKKFGCDDIDTLAEESFGEPDDEPGSQYNKDNDSDLEDDIEALKKQAEA